MKLELTDSETKNLLRMLSCAESMVEYTNDFIEDPKVATRARVWKKVYDKLLKAAHEQGMVDLITEDEGGYFIKEEEFNSIMEAQDEYGELITHQELSKKLAWRDFYLDHSPEDVLKMTEEKGSYLGVELYAYEEKYWKEFEKYEYNRLFIKE